MGHQEQFSLKFLRNLLENALSELTRRSTVQTRKDEAADAWG
jgi:hypothetical protein